MPLVIVPYRNISIILRWREYEKVKPKTIQSTITYKYNYMSVREHVLSLTDARWINSDASDTLTA